MSEIPRYDDIMTPVLKEPGGRIERIIQFRCQRFIYAVTIR